MADGATNWLVLDNPSLSIKKICQRLTFDFNNDDIKVELPAAAGDGNGLETMDENDYTCIQIHRNCETIVIYIITFFQLLTF